jgi:molecular chaperone DnaJ
MATDYYELLGVSRNATAEEVKRAYRRLARQLHPDANPGDDTAEARFKEVALAYEVLSDPEKRRRYDMFGDTGMGSPDAAGFGGNGGLGDIFDMFFGGNPFGGGAGGAPGPAGPPRGADLEAVVDLAFEDAVFGTEAPVTIRTAVACETCEGSGAETGTSAVTCGECGGAGQVRRVRQSILGQMVTAAPCPRCGGAGSIIEHPCVTCGGEGRRLEERTYTVDIPAGIASGQTLRLSGRGAVGPRGGGAGDLFVHVRVRPHPRFDRQGYDLLHELHLPFVQAALGATLAFETLDGTEELVIPRGTQTGKILRLRGRGVPHVEGRGRGDLLVQLVVDVPTELTKDEDDALRALAAVQGEEVAEPEAGLMSKIRSAFKS